MLTPTALGGAILGVSLANAFLQTWLGLTVLLNAERRTWGLFLACGALLAGAAFFVLQAVVAGYGLGNVWAAMYLQWPLGWYIGLLLPLAWYATMLWHARFWERRDTPLWRRHCWWLLVTLALCLGMLVLVTLAFSYPLSWVRGPFEPFARPAVHGVPVLAAAYPAFIVLCIVLSLDALRRPPPSPRFMGDLARQRARPWLIASSVGLLLVSLLVGAIMMYVGLRLPSRTDAEGIAGLPSVAVTGDLVVSVLVLASVLTLGQAIVAYEIFTGKTLPRRALRRYWRRTIALALVYGAFAGWSVATESSLFFALLAAAALLPALYALSNWSSYAERDRYTQQLRPFVAGPRVWDSLLGSEAPSVDAAAPFGALCGEVLGARAAYLVPVGPLSSLAGPTLAHPASEAAPADVSSIVSQATSPEVLSLPIDAATHGGATWGVPLWSGRGLIGLLLLGEKSDGSLYTQEEMEIARASAERLIDMLACARMAQRLAALQRQRLAESQVADRRTRRALHDEALPRLHAALLALSARQEGSLEEVVAQLSGVHRQLSDLLREMPSAAASELEQRGLLGALRRVPEHEFAGAFDSVIWEVESEAEGQTAALPALTAEVAFFAAREAIRNAATHAREADASRPLHLYVRVGGHRGLEVMVEDDGVGLGSGGTDSGSGQGMVLHSTMMAVIGGAWVTESLPGRFTRVTLSVPGTATAGLTPYPLSVPERGNGSTGHHEATSDQANGRGRPAPSGNVGGPSAQVR